MDSKEYFNQVAEQWDTMRADFFSESLREKALSLNDMAKGKTAADIGAGTGFMTEGLIRQDGMQVIAVDQSAEMLDVLKKYLLTVHRIFPRSAWLTYDQYATPFCLRKSPAPCEQLQIQRLTPLSRLPHE